MHLIFLEPTPQPWSPKPRPPTPRHQLPPHLQAIHPITCCPHPPDVVGWGWKGGGVRLGVNLRDGWGWDAGSKHAGHQQCEMLFKLAPVMALYGPYAPGQKLAQPLACDAGQPLA